MDDINKDIGIKFNKLTRRRTVILGKLPVGKIMQTVSMKAKQASILSVEKSGRLSALLILYSVNLIQEEIILDLLFLIASLSGCEKRVFSIGRTYCSKVQVLANGNSNEWHRLKFPTINNIRTIINLRRRLNFKTKVILTKNDEKFLFQS
jgi:hypothetical protein